MSENIVSGKDFLDKIVTVKMDRPLGTAHPKHGFIYEVNYGYIEGTVSGDGEELDAYVVGEHKPLETFEGRVVAVIHRTNDNDDKLVVMEDGRNYSDDQLEALLEFQERFFEHIILRPNK
ncbi:MAG: inorganic diphosphatase [Clostridia bacterium]|nr:inorganic diphosphatase [Clostridia bacterium]